MLLAAGLACGQRGKQSAANEWTVELAPLGYVTPHCEWNPQRVEFLDNERLAVSAPVNFSCDPNDRWNGAETAITVIDLEGHTLATSRHAGVIRTGPGPLGYFEVCTAERIELLAGDLKVAASFDHARQGKYSACLMPEYLSPSRTAIAIEEGDAQTTLYRLYRGASKEPIAEAKIANGQGVRAAADDGFVVCAPGSGSQCDVIGPNGKTWSARAPDFGQYVVGLLTPQQLLVTDYDGKRLFTETADGDETAVADLSKIKPLFPGTGRVAMSAVEPRRVLYSVDGCLLGDFDDCYGEVFHRFAVFDSATHQMLFRHNYAAGGEPKISPDGHVVMTVAGTELRLYRIP